MRGFWWEQLRVKRGSKVGALLSPIWAPSHFLILLLWNGRGDKMRWDGNSAFISRGTGGELGGDGKLRSSVTGQDADGGLTGRGRDWWTERRVAIQLQFCATQCTAKRYIKKYAKRCAQILVLLMPPKYEIHTCIIYKLAFSVSFGVLFSGTLGGKKMQLNCHPSTLWTWKNLRNVVNMMFWEKFIIASP